MGSAGAGDSRQDPVVRETGATGRFLLYYAHELIMIAERKPVLLLETDSMNSRVSLLRKGAVKKTCEGPVGKRDSLRGVPIALAVRRGVLYAPAEPHEKGGIEAEA